MAAVASLPETIRHDFLECGLCKGEFDTPKILPCLHTFCLHCLEGHIRLSTTSGTSLWFLCPHCRAITDIPSNKTKGFKTNTFVANLVRFAEAQLEKQRRISEDFKDERSVCGDATSSSSSYLKFDGRTKGERGGGRIDGCQTKPQTNGCKISTCACGDSCTTLFCEYCEQLICPVCVTAYHQNHELRLLEDKCNKEKDRFMNTVHNSRKEVAQLNEGIGDLEKYKVRLRTSKNEAVTKVKGHAAYLRKLIDQEEDKMLKNIDEIFEGETEKTENVIKENRNVIMILKSLIEFSTKLMKDGSNCEIVVWSAHTEEQVRGISGLGRKYGVERIRKEPIDIRFKAKDMDYYTEIKSLIGETEYGVNVDLLDFDMNAKEKRKIRELGLSEGDDLGTDKGTHALRIEESIYQGSLVHSFSAFTDGSHFPPTVVGIAATKTNDILVVDKTNKCVKIFGPDGGMYKKIHGSNDLWGVTVLESGNYAITDKTVHMFDTRGKLLKVLRQQPRDSHGITVDSNGDIIVADCMSRCIYILSSIGGTIKRMIIKRGKGIFKCPAYVTVNKKDFYIVSDCGLHTVSMFNEKAQFVKEFGVAGKEGSDATHLDCPSGVCTDKFGNIIVCDKNNDRMIMLDPECIKLKCVLVQGNDIHRPQAVTINSEGHLVVAEEGGRIKIFKYWGT